jgi:CRISPR/Cas system-associated exonuclease Cas4 (RecB family)
MDYSVSKPLMYDSMIDEIVKAFHLGESRYGIHMSDCIYCPRKAYYNQTAYVYPTPKEIKYFIRGIALQDAILHKEPKPMEKDGVIFSPDFWDGKELIELKTTTMSRKRMDEGNIPDGWIRQIAAYCYALGIKFGYLVVFIINDHTDDLPPCYRLEFEEDELIDNWMRIIEARDLILKAIEEGKPPAVETAEWLCKDCRYSLRCKHN